MSRWDVLAAICDRLAVGLLGHAPSSGATTQSWETLIEASSHHLVTPALAWSMRDADCPPDVRGYFDAVLTLNRDRNEAIATTLARVAGLLNEAGIEPVLLKGAAHLATGLYSDPAIRVIGDIDVLIPDGRAPDAWEQLCKAGFADLAPTAFVSLPMHHLPRLSDATSHIGVELHTEVIRRSFEGLLPIPWFVDGAEAGVFRGCRVRIPHATRRVAHTIVHDQLQDAGYSARGRSGSGPSSIWR